MKLYSTTRPVLVNRDTALELGSNIARPYLLSRRSNDLARILERNGLTLSSDTEIIETEPGDVVAQEIMRTHVARENMPLLHHTETLLGCNHHHQGVPDYEFPVVGRFVGDKLTLVGTGVTAARRGRRMAATQRRHEGRARELAVVFGEDWAAMAAARQELWIRATKDMSSNTGHFGLSNIMLIAIKFANNLEPVELDHTVERTYKGNENFLSLPKERQWHWYQFAKQAARILPAPLSYRQGQGI